MEGRKKIMSVNSIFKRITSTSLVLCMIFAFSIGNTVIVRADDTFDFGKAYTELRSVGEIVPLYISSSFSGPVEDESDVYIILSIDDSDSQLELATDMPDWEKLDEYKYKIPASSFASEYGGSGIIYINVMFKNGVSHCSSAGIASANMTAELHSVADGLLEKRTITVEAKADFNWSFTQTASASTLDAYENVANDAVDKAYFELNAANASSGSGKGEAFTGKVTVTQTITLPPYLHAEDILLSYGSNTESMSMTIDTFGREVYTFIYTQENGDDTKEMPDFSSRAVLGTLTTLPGFDYSDADIISEINIEYKDISGNAKTAGPLTSSITVKEVKNEHYTLDSGAIDAGLTKTVATADMSGTGVSSVLISPYSTAEQRKPIFTLGGFGNPYSGGNRHIAENLSDYTVCDDFSVLAADNHFWLSTVTAGEYSDGASGAVTPDIEVYDGTGWQSIGSVATENSGVYTFADDESISKIRFNFGTITPDFEILTEPTIELTLADEYAVFDTAQVAGLYDAMLENTAYVEYTFAEGDSERETAVKLNADPGASSPKEVEADKEHADVYVINRAPISLGLGKFAVNPDPSRRITTASGTVYDDNYNEGAFNFFSGDTVNYTLKVKVGDDSATGASNPLVRPVVVDYIDAANIAVDTDGLVNLSGVSLILYNPSTKATTTLSSSDYTCTVEKELNHYFNSNGSTADAFKVTWSIEKDIPQGSILLVNYSIVIKEDASGASGNVFINNEFSVYDRTPLSFTGGSGGGGIGPGGTIPVYPPGTGTSAYGFKKISLTTLLKGIGIRKTIASKDENGAIIHNYRPEDSVEFDIVIKNISQDSVDTSFNRVDIIDYFMHGYDPSTLQIYDSVLADYVTVKTRADITGGMFVKKSASGTDSYINTSQVLSFIVNDTVEVTTTGSYNSFNAVFSGGSFSFDKDEEISFKVKLSVREADKLKDWPAYGTSHGNTVALSNYARVQNLPVATMFRISGSDPWGTNYLYSGNSSYVMDTADVVLEKEGKRVVIDKMANSSNNYNIDAEPLRDPAYTVRIKNLGIEKIGAGAYVLDRLPFGQTVDTVIIRRGTATIDPADYTIDTKPGSKTDELGQLVKITFGFALDYDVDYSIVYTTKIDKDTIAVLPEFVDGDLVSKQYPNYVGLFSGEFEGADLIFSSPSNIRILNNNNQLQYNSHENYNGKAVIKDDPQYGNWSDTKLKIYGFNQSTMPQRFAEALDTMTYSVNEIRPGIKKELVTSQPINPGQNVQWKITVRNGSNATKAIDVYTIVEVLPEDFTFVNAAGNYTGYTEGVNSKGENIITFSFDGKLAAGQSNSITITTTLPKTYFETRTNFAYFIPMNGTFTNLAAGTSADVGVKNTPTDTEKAAGIFRKSVSSSENIDAFGNLKISSIMTVASGAKYADSKGPNSIELERGQKDAEYTMNVSNRGDYNLTDIVMINIFPYFNDKGVVATARDRGTDAKWTPKNIRVTGVKITSSAGEPIPLIEGSDYRIEFSSAKTGSNFPLDANDWKGDLSGKWVTAYDDSAAMRIVFTSVTLEGGGDKTLTVTYTADVPDEATNGTTVWSSFGYECKNAFVQQTRLRSEPPRVGIKIIGSALILDKKIRTVAGSNVTTAAPVGEAANEKFTFEITEVGGSLKKQIVLEKANNFTETVYDLKRGTTYTIKEIFAQGAGYRFVTAEGDDLTIRQNSVTFKTDENVIQNYGISVVNEKTPKQQPVTPPGGGGSGGGPSYPSTPAAGPLVDPNAPPPFGGGTDGTPSENSGADEYPLGDNQTPSGAFDADKKEEEEYIDAQGVPLGNLPKTGGIMDLQALLLGIAGVVSGLGIRRKKK